MLLGPDATPFDAIHLNTAILAVGSFRLDCEQPQFIARKALLHHHIVLPRAPLCILQDGVAPFVADPVMVTFHNPGVAYRREPIARRDDDCDYVVLHPETVDEIACEAELSRAGRRVDYRFVSSQSLLAPTTFAAARRMFDIARQGACPSLLALEEAALAFATAAMRGLHGASGARASGKLRDGALASRRDPVTRAKRYLAEHPERRHTLGAIARAAYVSPYHLTRLFRSRTGLSLHQYAMTLKVRAALNSVDRYKGRVGVLARELGFCDLAHLSRHFTLAFGVSPAVYLGRRRPSGQFHLAEMSDDGMRRRR